MQQVLIIHGGTAFSTYEEYLVYLQGKEVSLERLRSQGWKHTFSNFLGSGYEVFNPVMPNGANAKYEEWKIWFKKLLELFDDNLILIGHSLGGVFLAKFLSEEVITTKIQATILVAAPYNQDEGRALPEFSVNSPLNGLAQQGGKVILYHSKDDPVVSFSELEKYREALPDATVRIFEDRQHFNQEEFPELIEAVRSL